MLQLKITYCLLSFVVIFISSAQADNYPTEWNFGFEKIPTLGQLPCGWFNRGVGYDLFIETTGKNTGNVSMRIQLMVK